MNKQFLKDGLLWGFLLWLFGYILGIVFFMFVPSSLIGWIITPMGIVAALFVLQNKIKAKDLSYYLKLSVVWTILAIVLDYFLLVKVFKPADGYYKLDVYLYYVLTFILPLLVGWWKNRKS